MVYTVPRFFYNQSETNDREKIMTEYDLTVRAQDVVFTYEGADRPAVNKVSFELKKGSYTALLGANGSGKSTLAKLMDVLELPESGKIVVFGIDTKDEENYWDIRCNAGCVFQNPDNQIVGTTVEEDVAFGPENLGVPNPELRERVDRCLSFVGLSDYKLRQTAKLSGGQKQKLAIAGVLAMNPDLLILDEATAMLDPVSRDEFLSLVERLVRERGITVITITHDMTEAARTGEVIIMNGGKIIDRGEPRRVMADVQKMLDARLDAPLYSKFLWYIDNIHGKKSSLDDRSSLLSSLAWLKENYSGVRISAPVKKTPERETLVKIKNLSYSYEDNGKCVLHDINLDIKKGELLALVGRSGCGKTTLITHLNGIIRLQGDSEIIYRFGDETLSPKNKKDIKKIRQKVGLVFQYPEYQLFEETVYRDIAYGPKMMGMSEEEQKKAVYDAAKAVGLSEDTMEKSPFELSGGQQRRVAIAGVIAMRPEVLVLDEPAAGLDPEGRREMFSMISELKKNSGTTIILVTHYMDEAYEHADRICCIKDGRIMKVAEPEEMFDSKDEMIDMEIRSPYMRRFLETAAVKIGLSPESKNALLSARSLEEAAKLLGGADA